MSPSLKHATQGLNSNIKCPLGGLRQYEDDDDERALKSDTKKYLNGIDKGKYGGRKEGQGYSDKITPVRMNFKSLKPETNVKIAILPIYTMILKSIFASVH